MSNEEEKLVNLTEGLSIRNLLSGEGATFEVNFNDASDVDETNIYAEPEILDHLKPECCGLEDEDTYEQAEPFEKLSAKMISLHSDDKIKKRIIREGYGTVLPANSTVTIHYNAYLEYNDEPYDSTYVRKKPFTFVLNNGEALPGLDYAVSTMKLNEKSQFLIHHDYAYGKFGCAPRIPPEATILFEVEIKNCIDSGACLKYQQLDEVRQQDFDEIYKYSLALCDKARDLFKKGMLRQAIKDYNIAVDKLENCQLPDYCCQEKQQELLFRLYKNLVICNTKVGEARRACINYNNLCKMCKGTSLKIPTKIYYQHARSLMLLGEYGRAELELKFAQRLEPQNREVSRELINLNLKKKEDYEREVKLSKAICNVKKYQGSGDEGITDGFRKLIASYCNDLICDKDSNQYYLPDDLDKTDIEFVKNEVAKHKLQFVCHSGAEYQKYKICKVPIN